jgi:hypothetical protein
MACEDVTFPRCREPLWVTVARTGAIALGVGLVIALRRGGLAYWPVAALLVLWPSFGGHWVEVFYLNGVRPRLPAEAGLRAAVRVGIWFVGGTGLWLGMVLTAMALGGLRAGRWPAWWIGGVAFIGIELVAHLVLWWRGRPSFYDGRG